MSRQIIIDFMELGVFGLKSWIIFGIYLSKVPLWFYPEEEISENRGKRGRIGKWKKGTKQKSEDGRIGKGEGLGMKIRGQMKEHKWEKGRVKRPMVGEGRVKRVSFL